MASANDSDISDNFIHKQVLMNTASLICNQAALKTASVCLPTARWAYDKEKSSPELSALGEPHHRGQGFELLGMAADRVEQEVVGAHGYQRFQPLPHLLRCAVDP